MEHATNFCSHQRFRVTVGLDRVFLISLPNLPELEMEKSRHFSVFLEVVKAVLIYFSLFRKRA